MHRGLDENGLLISPLKAATPPATEIARRAAYDRLPRVKITDLLLEVDAWTGFSECFIHRRSGREADDRNALLTVILADGINLGLTRMAETCRGASLRQLAHLHDWHISEAAYGEALGRLIDAHRAMPLAALWGDGTTSSSDGQQFHAGGRGAAIGDINARSGNEPGVAFYTHVSDRYDPFASRVIAATAGEAPYVLDGLLYHQTGLTIEEHYTDTGGASDHVFGLMPFFGYRFAPRLRDIKERRLHLLPGQESGPLLAGMTAEPIALGHVAAHWDELLRFATQSRLDVRAVAFEQVCTQQVLHGGASQAARVHTKPRAIGLVGHPVAQVFVPVADHGLRGAVHDLAHFAERHVLHLVIHHAGFHVEHRPAGGGGLDGVLLG